MGAQLSAGWRAKWPLSSVYLASGAILLGMGRGTNNGSTKRISIRLTPEAAVELEGLALLGLYGGSASEVARRLIEHELERISQDQIVERVLRSRALLSGIPDKQDLAR